MFNGSPSLVDQILISFVLWVFIVTGFIGVALGVALNISSARALHILKKMNRWISLRSSLKPMEQPHDIEKIIYRQRRWFGAAFVAGGAFTVYMLLFEVKFPYVIAALSKNTAPVIVELLVESMKWFLVSGGVLGIVIGVMMLASTCGLQAFEARVNRWYSTRQIAKGVDEMHMTLDNLAEAFPRTAGLLLAFSSAIVLVAATIVWLGT